ncbi:hypothetical protein EJB05_19872, partial [Eragrostis curvula]
MPGPADRHALPKVLMPKQTSLFKDSKLGSEADCCRCQPEPYEIEGNIFVLSTSLYYKSFATWKIRNGIAGHK